MAAIALTKELYFTTTTVIDWLDIFTRPLYKHGYGERCLMAGAEVGLAIGVVHRSLCMERVARLVHPHLQRQPTLRTHHIVRVVGCVVIALRQYAVHETALRRVAPTALLHHDFLPVQEIDTARRVEYLPATEVIDGDIAHGVG